MLTQALWNISENNVTVEAFGGDTNGYEPTGATAVSIAATSTLFYWKTITIQKNIVKLVPKTFRFSSSSASSSWSVSLTTRRSAVEIWTSAQASDSNIVQDNMNFYVSSNTVIHNITRPFLRKRPVPLSDNDLRAQPPFWNVSYFWIDFFYTSRILNMIQRSTSINFNSMVSVSSNMVHHTFILDDNVSRIWCVYVKNFNSDDSFTIVQRPIRSEAAIISLHATFLGIDTVSFRENSVFSHTERSVSSTSNILSGTGPLQRIQKLLIKDNRIDTSHVGFGNSSDYDKDANLFNWDKSGRYNFWTVGLLSSRVPAFIGPDKNITHSSLASNFSPPSAFEVSNNIIRIGAFQTSAPQSSQQISFTHVWLYDRVVNISSMLVHNNTLQLLKNNQGGINTFRKDISGEFNVIILARIVASLENDQLHYSNNSQTNNSIFTFTNNVIDIQPESFRSCRSTATVNMFRFSGLSSALAVQGNSTSFIADNNKVFFFSSSSSSSSHQFLSVDRRFPSLLVIFPRILLQLLQFHLHKQCR
jgi:hypothetical protein